MDHEENWDEHKANRLQAPARNARTDGPPDLVLIGLGRLEGDEIGLSLVRLLPNAKVIAFSSDGRNAFTHRMQPQRTALLDVSPQMLIDAISGL